MLADRWSEWSDCSVRCGTGIKRRVRRVLRAPLNGGRPCADNTVEKAVCEGTSCKVARASHGFDELRGQSPQQRKTSLYVLIKTGLHEWFLQRVRIARNADSCNSQRISVCPTVCLSVRPSITFRCFVQTNEHTIVRSSVSGRTIILVSEEVKFIRTFEGDHLSEGVKVRHSPVASENLTDNQP